MDKLFKIHFIAINKLILKQFSNTPPSIGDEIRIGGIGKEKFYKVVRRVFIYDEPECDYQRVNIGLEIADEL